MNHDHVQFVFLYILYCGEDFISMFYLCLILFALSKKICLNFKKNNVEDLRKPNNLI